MMVNAREPIQEIRPSPRVVVVMLLASAFVLVAVDDIWPEPDKRLRVQQFELLLYGMSAAILLVHYWNPLFSRYFSVAIFVFLLNLSYIWLGSADLLLLMPLAVALAAALLGLVPAVLTTGGQAVLLLGITRYVDPHLSLAPVIMTIMAMVGTLGVMVAVYRPTYQMAGWLKNYFERARLSLEEARQNKVEMKQMLSELAQANRELALLSERLAGMRLVAEEAQKAKAAFAAKISHEFRTPLNMIIGLIDTLAETPEVYGQNLPPTLLKDLQIVYRNSHHLASMVEDVLDLSQTEGGQLTLHREWVDLVTTIKNAVEVVRPLLEKKHLSLQVSLPPDLPQVYCDEIRIRQVILNLVSNAARYTEQGGVSVSIVHQNQDVVVSVKDTGPGIAPGEAERIFEPFYQSKNGFWREQGGTGLGLSISQQFVSHHGGQLWLESRVNRGSTFSFRLPVAPTAPPPAGPKRWLNQDWVFHERTTWPKLPELPYQQRVVICDETETLYPLLTRYTDEIEFVKTKNLVQASQAVRACPAHAVILNGTSFHNLELLIDQGRLDMPDTPIIGCSLPLRLEDALAAGAVDYLVKPVRRSDLEKCLQAAKKPVRRVLVVDDNLDILELFKRMLLICEPALEVTTAASGPKALEMLRAWSPDMVLLDIVMPDMDGWQVLKRKEQDEAIKDIPVILVSAEDIADQPPQSKALVAAMGRGFSVSKMLNCSLQLSALLLSPDSEPVPKLE